MRGPRSPTSPSTVRPAIPGNSSWRRSSNTTPTSRHSSRTTTSPSRIPYVHKGRTHNYVPDFLVRLRRRPDEAFDRTLIVEVSGSQKSPGPTQAKANTARNSWCVAVNNHEGFGRWGYVEMTDPLQFKPMLADAIQALYGDLPIIGDPDLLDLDYRSARGA